MAWQPKNNAIDTTAIETNLTAFIKANQADALRWANNGTNLKLFNFAADQIENLNKPNLPTISVIGAGETEVSSQETLIIDYRIDYESIVFGKDAGALPALTKKYANALKSLLKNISPALLLEAVPGEQQVMSTALGSNYREIGQSESLSGFIQIFQVRATYRLMAISIL